MAKLDVDALFYNNDMKTMLAFNTKFSNVALTGAKMEKFRKNVVEVEKRFPDVTITVVHCALHVDDQQHNASIQEIVDRSAFGE